MGFFFLKGDFDSVLRFVKNADDARVFYDCRILSLRALPNLGYAFISCVSGFIVFHTKILYSGLYFVHILCDYQIVFNDVVSNVSDPDSDWIRIQLGQWIRIRNPDPGGQK
jgi:hypothetical protein